MAGPDDGASPPLSGENVAGARPRTRAEIGSARVEAIIKAAEEAAERMRHEAEWRMRERIAEGTRAAENQGQAAEGGAGEILNAAPAQAGRPRDPPPAPAPRGPEEARAPGRPRTRCRPPRRRRPRS